ncbi:cell division protein [Opisthorchis viverrini]|uniref:Cell division protein n=1 Tax=Opisthorchis viverrini TaxID=6198 RepID=A0A1S8WSH2_OPIVI|nr:cell division protein [Opisthorchis viverrini]
MSYVSFLFDIRTPFQNSSVVVGSNKRTAYSTKDLLSNFDTLKLSSKDVSVDREPNADDLVSRNGYSGKRTTDSLATGDSYVGYCNLPNQVYRKAVRRGFEFNLMVVGESGLGKSTFINSLFLSEVYNAEYPGPSRRPKKTLSVESTTVVLKEQGVYLKLKLVDTPGFGDSIDNSNCWQPIVDYINSRFDDHIAGESRVNRSPYTTSDQRIHALIYFIAPTGHSLKQIDVEFLKRIQDKVNVIPVIAKADTMTVDECREFKKVIQNELAALKIRTFEFPDPPECEVRGNEEELVKIRRLRDRAPFAVVGANTLVSGGDGGSRVRARTYPWGVVEVDNLEHNDFPALRYLLLTAFLQELRDVTHNVHYENYRSAKLSGIAEESHFQTRDGKDPMALMEAEKKEHELKMRKMEAEMEAVFEQKVQEKTQKLREFEADILRRSEQIREQLRAQEQEQEAARRAFELERANWEEAWREWDVGADLSTNGSALGLGERVMNEVIKERVKTEKKRKGLF